MHIDIPAPVSGVSIDPEAILRRFYPTGSPTYAILHSHSRDVAMLALEILAANPSLQQQIDARFVYEAAMLHDIGIFLTDTPSLGCTGREPYIKHGFLGGELLREMGLERHAQVCERHTGTGITTDRIRMSDLPLPLDVLYMPQSLEEKLICFADKFYSKGHPGERKTPEAARRIVARHGVEGARRFDDLAALFPLPHAQ